MRGIRNGTPIHLVSECFFDLSNLLKLGGGLFIPSYRYSSILFAMSSPWDLNSGIENRWFNIGTKIEGTPPQLRTLTPHTFHGRIDSQNQYPFPFDSRTTTCSSTLLHCYTLLYVPSLRAWTISTTPVPLLPFSFAPHSLPWPHFHARFIVPIVLEFSFVVQ